VKGLLEQLQEQVAEDHLSTDLENTLDYQLHLYRKYFELSILLINKLILTSPFKTHAYIYL
jgi:hypothetical protein